MKMENTCYVIWVKIENEKWRWRFITNVYSNRSYSLFSVVEFSSKAFFYKRIILNHFSFLLKLLFRFLKCSCVKKLSQIKKKLNVTFSDNYCWDINLNFFIVEILLCKYKSNIHNFLKKVYFKISYMKKSQLIF